MGNHALERLIERHPEKFPSEEKIFSNLRPGDRIFLSTACAEPQHLVQMLTEYVRSNPKRIFDTEILQVWTLGVAPYADSHLRPNLRHNSFFVGANTRDAVNSGQADYTPIFLSQVPGLFRRGLVPVDVALIQVSLPDQHGFFSLGVSVDIVKSAVENAAMIIAQINPRMPRTYGDGFVSIDQIDFAVVHEEPILEFENTVPGEIARRIGHYVSRIVQDGDTIQVGYGSIPNAVLSALGRKKHLGIHTELLTDGIVELIRSGVVDNSRKTLNQGRTVTSFCMGRTDTYAFIDGNPTIEFRGIDYTNDPLVIARHENMTAINSAMEIDLTGQATAESIGMTFYSGIGGQADFMRGALLAQRGKSILALQSTAENGEVSRIVPFVKQGAGVTLNRGDIHYVVTEYGTAHLHGKNIRERALDLIAIAHPRFRPWLILAGQGAESDLQGSGLHSREGGGVPGTPRDPEDDQERHHCSPAPGQDHRRAVAQVLLLLPVRREHVHPVHERAEGHAARAAPGVHGHRLHEGDGHPRGGRARAARAGGRAGRILPRGGEPGGQRRLHRPGRPSESGDRKRASELYRLPGPARGAARPHGGGPDGEQAHDARLPEAPSAHGGVLAGEDP